MIAIAADFGRFTPDIVNMSKAIRAYSRFLGYPVRVCKDMYSHEFTEMMRTAFHGEVMILDVPLTSPNMTQFAVMAKSFDQFFGGPDALAFNLLDAMAAPGTFTNKTPYPELWETAPKKNVVGLEWDKVMELKAKNVSEEAIGNLRQAKERLEELEISIDAEFERLGNKDTGEYNEEDVKGLEMAVANFEAESEKFAKMSALLGGKEPVDLKQAVKNYEEEWEKSRKEEKRQWETQSRKLKRTNEEINEIWNSVIDLLTDNPDYDPSKPEDKATNPKRLEFGISDYPLLKEFEDMKRDQIVHNKDPFSGHQDVPPEVEEEFLRYYLFLQDEVIPSKFQRVFGDDGGQSKLTDKLLLKQFFRQMVGVDFPYDVFDDFPKNFPKDVLESKPGLVEFAEKWTAEIRREEELEEMEARDTALGKFDFDLDSGFPDDN